RDLFLYELDRPGQQVPIQGDILSPHVFPFDISNPEDLYIYQVRFQLLSQPNGHTTFLLNRKFLRDTTFQFEGNTYPSIQFSTLGSVDQRDTIAGAIEPVFSGREIYAKGLGLVYYERSYGQGGPSFQHQLVDRYSMEVFADKAKAELDVQ
ncbi:MAG: hypothetical protein AAGA62_17710, partial [Bacteroidota bacterium]